MDNIIVRQPTSTDDFSKIASCIYLTDPFIYPAAFGTDIAKATCAISKLMNIKNGLFHLNNLVLAFHEEEICGVLLYNKNGSEWDVNKNIDLLQGIVPSIENFRLVSEVYFSIEATPPPIGHVEVIACCVMPEFRNIGVGKLMLEWLIREYSNHTLTLDVLANNSAAINLYKKCGFVIMNEFTGFSLEESERPDCYRMIRTTKNIV